MAALGGFCPLPIRLGGDALSGLTAEQHARIAADLVAVKRAAPFCVFSWSSATLASIPIVSSYRGMNGVGSDYAPNNRSINGSGTVTFRWTNPAFADDYQIAYGFLPRHAVATANSTSFARAVCELLSDGVNIRLFDAAGVQIAPPIAGSCVIW